MWSISSRLHTLGPLTHKHEKRLLTKQYRQASKRLGPSIADRNNCLHLTFPIAYSCPMKSKKNISSTSTHSSVLSRVSTASVNSLVPSPTMSPLANTIDRLKSAATISFLEDQLKSPASPFLTVPSRKKSAQPMRSSNASIERRRCELCQSVLANGVCSCIVRDLLAFNHRKEDEFFLSSQRDMWESYN